MAGSRRAEDLLREHEARGLLALFAVRAVFAVLVIALNPIFEIDAFAALARARPDDSLARLHHARPAAGESGALLDLSGV